MATAKKRSSKTVAAMTAAKKKKAAGKGVKPASKAGAKSKVAGLLGPGATIKKTDSKAAAGKTAGKAPVKAAAAKSADKMAKKSAKKAADKAAKKAAKKAASQSEAAKQAAKSVKKAGKKAKKADKKAVAPPRPQTSAAPPVPAPPEAGPAPSHDEVAPELFLPLTDGERAAALRVLTEDARLASMAKVGRYRVIAVEPLAVKPPHRLAGRRLARAVIYDYASDSSVDACVDLEQNRVAHLNVSRAQPMLAREEEAAAIAIALSDERVKEQLSLGDEPQVAMHYWSAKGTSLSYARRSAAVLFGRPDSSPSLVAVVDLLDNLVCEIVPATRW